LKNPFDKTVNRKDKHINKYLHDALPEPEIQADDAWAQMNDMLVPNSAGASQNLAGKVAKYVSQFKWPLLTTLGGISISVLIILSPDSQLTTSKVKKEQQTNDSLKRTDAKPDNVIGKYEKSDSKSGSAHVSQKKEKNDVTDNTGDSTHADSENGPATQKNDPVISKIENEIEIAISDKHVNASQSHEKSISNVNKKPDLKVQSENLTIRESVDNGRVPARNSFRSRKATGSSDGGGNESGVDNGTTGNNSGRGSGRINNNNSVLSSIPKEYNVPVSLYNKSADIPSANKMLIRSLTSLPFHYKPFRTDLAKKVKAPKMSTTVQAADSKKTKSLPIHFGLEWNLNAPLQHTAYLFTGTDSIRRPARLLIPGIFVSKNWEKHTVSFSFSSYQPYFGNNKRVQQLSDTISGSDSAKIYYNANLIKASGMNFTFQYQYQVLGPLLLNAGLSYSTFSRALIRKETENRFGSILQGPLVTVKKSGDLRSYINPGFFALKAGLAVRPAVFQGRIQAGLNIIVPISNVSNSAENPLRALNGQVYLRVMVR
jgi:hypothetical protein